jgi:hypothetical protein
VFSLLTLSSAGSDLEAGPDAMVSLGDHLACVYEGPSSDQRPPHPTNAGGRFIISLEKITSSIIVCLFDFFDFAMLLAEKGFEGVFTTSLMRK